MRSKKNFIRTLIISTILCQAGAVQAADVNSALDQLLVDMKPKQQASVYSENLAQGDQSISLRQALSATYAQSPQILAARAALRAVDEEYAQAVSGYRPSVNGAASYVSSRTDDGVSTTGADPKSLSIEVTQPLYRGGSTRAEVAGSESLIKAQRASLAKTEQDVFLSVVSAYMTTLSAREITLLTSNNIKVLEEQLQAARARFKLGDITKTDVSQAESRLANALAQHVTAEGDLKKSRAEFERLTGLTGDALVIPGQISSTPASLENALEEADTHNPMLIAARYNRSAAEAGTRAVVGELLPQIDLEGSVGRTYDTVGGDSREDSGALALRATIPFYSGGGATYSRIRQSRQIESQRKQEIADTERTVRQGVIEAWEELAATEAEKKARLVQIEAAKTALDGVKLETQYGSRTTLDLLDAEQEYLDAKVAYVQAERNNTIATYGLLSAIGRLGVRDLGLDVNYYDSERNFQNVKNQWFGGNISEQE